MSETINAMFSNQVDSGNSLIPDNFQGPQNTNQNNLIQKEMIIRLETRNVICYAFSLIFFIFIIVAILFNLISSNKSYTIPILILSIILSVFIIVFFFYIYT